ncbi:MAG: adenylate/guanylate cyclase domain-containing response regulator [Betaproteobacteria bacterium]|nr:MAG: adenylate/guanylate cyclase domain-containing response regulator [Betaproteobacteria bacterium]
MVCAVGGNYRIALVVADEASAEFVDCHLAGTSIELERLTCGKQFFSANLGRPDVDLIIVDADDGGGASSMRGLALGRALKSSPLTVSIPLIVIGKSEADRLRSFEIGVDDYVFFCTSQDEFILRLTGLLRVGSARRAAIKSQLDAEAKRGKEIGDAFRRYVAPALVDEILSDRRLLDSALADKSTRVTATVLFADMRGFTRMSEQLEAADVVPLLNQYFRLLTQIAFHYQGTVFNMAGDCLMVGFGVPFEQADATVRAFRTAREMLVRFSELIAEWKVKFGVEAGLGIGINEGDVVVGNVGSPDYMNYTVIGDAVNVAARLSQRARAGELLFSRRVKKALDAAGEQSGALQRTPISLRGRTESIEIYCVPVNPARKISLRLSA